LFFVVLLLRAQKKNQEKGKKNDASTHGPTPSPPFFYAYALRRMRLLRPYYQILLKLVDFEVYVEKVSHLCFIFLSLLLLAQKK
jgi:hypothetical protein